MNVNSTKVGLPVLDYFLYTNWYETSGGNPDAYYLDRRAAKDDSRLNTWRDSLGLKSPLRMVPVFFLCDSIDHWPRLVVFNYERNTILIIGKGDNVNEFKVLPESPGWNHLWMRVSATMGWIPNTENPKILEANWISVSIHVQRVLMCYRHIFNRMA